MTEEEEKAAEQARAEANEFLRLIHEPVVLFTGIPQGSFLTTLTVLRLGFCGSLTSFAGWNQTMVQLFAAGAWQLPMIGYLGGLMLSLVTVYFGQRCALFVARGITDHQRQRNAERARKLGNYFRQQRTTFKVLGGLFILVVYALMASVSYLHYKGVLSDGLSGTSKDADPIGILLPLRLSLALLWAPLGVLLRWRLVLLNTIYPPVPLGTLLANLLGVGLIGVIYAFDDDATPYSPFWDEVAHSIALGFCGCLTTVSTFAFEVISRLRPEQLSTNPKEKQQMCTSRSCWCAGPIYALITLFAGCLIGLAAYTPHNCLAVNDFCHTQIEAGAWLGELNRLQLEPAS